MKKFPVALQLYSVRDDMAADFEGTIKKVADMGYDGVEFAGLFDYNNAPEKVRDMCLKAGVEPVSAHVSFEEIISDVEGVVGKYGVLGVKFIAIPWLAEEKRPGGPGFNVFKEGIFKIGEVCKKHGMRLCYHNHDFEFRKYDNEYVLDYMYRVIPEDVLKTQLDTCWVNVGGEDPARYIMKYSGRAPIVHLKDFIMPGKKPVRMYQLIGVDDVPQSDVKEEASFEFRPLGYGAQDFNGILEAAETAGAEWVVVEQDSPSMGKSAMECAQMSIDYLRSIE